MPLMINTNVASLNSQRQLLQVGADLDQASERLSSGKRINSAADDAAGLAISNRQTSQIRGLDQAIRNANDGISLIQTAEGALDESTNILQRMRELSIQASNGVYSDSDRSSLNAEVEQLKAELDRIAETTAFNGQNILDGTLGQINLQVGSEANETISLDVQGFSSASLGGASGDIVGSALTAGLTGLTGILTADGAVTINDVSISATTGTTVSTVLDSINSDLDGKGVDVGALVTHEGTAVGTGELIAGTHTLTIAVVDGEGNSNSYVITDTNNMDELISKINSDTTVTASLNDDGYLVLSQDGAESIQTTDTSTNDSATGITDATTNFALTFSDTTGSGEAIKLENNTTNVTATEMFEGLGINETDDNGNTTGGTVGAAAAAVTEGQIVINGVELGAVVSGSSAADSVDKFIVAINEISDQTGVVAYEGTTTGTEISLRSTTGEFSIEVAKGLTAANLTTYTGLKERNASAGAGSIASVDVSSLAGAQRAIDIIDVAIEQVNTQRADLGAINNRLDFTISNLANVSENTSAARSRIMDTDFASETAQLSRAQVLQQASQAMLAQANARPQQVLSLLN